MNFVFTTWLYPLREPIILSESPRFLLDNPRSSEEIARVTSLLGENYRHELRYFFPPTAKKKYISLDWMISRFRDRFGPSDEYVLEVLKGHSPKAVFESLSRIWIVARYDDEGEIRELEEARDKMRSDGQIGFFLLEDDNPTLLNSIKLQNFLSLLSLLIHSEEDEYFGRSILLGSEDHSIREFPFDRTLLENALIMFMVHSAGSDERTKPDKLSWTCFPYAQKRLIEAKDSLRKAFSRGDEDLLMYVGNILRVAQHDARDIRVRFLLLVSLMELLLTHNPDSSRYNVEDSINRQFRLKTGIVVHLQHPKIKLDVLEARLKKLYELRSAIAHGNFEAIVKYQRNLSKRKGEEEYFDDVVTDAYFYLRAVVEEYLRDPEFVNFIKKS